MNNKMLGHCKACAQDYCQECCDNTNWEKFCSESCETDYNSWSDEEKEMSVWPDGPEAISENG